MRGIITKVIAGIGVVAVLGLVPVSVAGAGVGSTSSSSDCVTQAASWSAPWVFGDPNPGRHNAHTTFLEVQNGHRDYIVALPCDNPPPSSSLSYIGYIG